VELVKNSRATGRRLCERHRQCRSDDEAGIYEQRERVAALKQKLAKLDAPEVKLLLPRDTLVKKSVWILGGDGWATTSATAAWTTCWRADAM